MVPYLWSIVAVLVLIELALPGCSSHRHHNVVILASSRSWIQVKKEEAAGLTIWWTIPVSGPSPGIEMAELYRYSE